MPSPMDTFEGYLIDDVIGHGGSGTVYRARHADAPTEAVAMKMLDEHHHDPAHLTQLLREFEFARRASHPHVVTMYECGPGWLTMQLGAGTAMTLTTREDRLTALAQIASALDNAHELGIVHCDVKPLNILVLEDFSTEGVILTDFGIARSVTEDIDDRRPMHVAASLPYVAPEVLRGHPPSAASDEYALACTAVELLTGTTPFVAVTQIALVDAQLNGPVPRYARRFDWIPHAFDSILAKAMAKDPEKRYQTCSEFVALITRTLR